MHVAVTMRVLHNVKKAAASKIFFDFVDFFFTVDEVKQGGKVVARGRR